MTVSLPHLGYLLSNFKPNKNDFFESLECFCVLFKWLTNYAFVFYVNLFQFVWIFRLFVNHVLLSLHL